MADGSLIFDTKIDQSGFEKDAGSLKSTATKITSAIGLTLSAGAIAKGLVSMGKQAVTQGSAFESAMSQVAATMGTTTDQIQDLSNVAKEMGSTTSFSATEAANALNYLALAGFDAQQQMDALPTVLNLAAAGSMDLAYASDLVTDSMSALGLDIKDMAGFADQMAKASSSSNTSVAQLGEAILVCGGQARLAGMNTVELNTALGILADNGIKGSEGGTALRNTLKNLYTPTAAARQELEKLGVSVADKTTGEMRDLQSVLQDLNLALNDLNPDERMNVMAKIFDTRTIAAANALLANSGDRFTELSYAIENSLGAASAMARTQLDNLRGDITLAQSALEGLSVTAYQSFSGSLRGAVQSFTGVVSGLTDALGKGGLQGAVNFITDEFPLATAAVAGLAAGFGALAIIKGITSMMRSFQTAQLQVALACMEGSIATAAETGALTAKEIVVAALTGKLTLAQAAQALFNKTVLANPYVAAAAAIGAMVAGLILLEKHVTNANPQLRELRDNTAAVAQANKELKTAQEESASSYASTNAEIESQAIYAQNTYQKLKQLSDGYTGTQAEQRLMAQLCSELNSSVEGLNISFDAQTGALNTTADAMDTYIQKMKQQAQAAANMERYTQLIKEQSDAEYNLFLAKRNHAEAEILLEEGAAGSYMAMTRANGALDDAQKAYDGATEATAAFEEYMAESASVTEESADAVTELGVATEDLGESLESVVIAGVEVSELLDQLGMSAEEAQQRFDSYADAATNMFGRIKTESELSTKDMIGNLDFNAQAIEQYGENLARLAQVLPEDLYTALAGDPAQMAGIVAELASSSDTELAQLAESFSSAGDAAREAWLTSMGAISMDESNPITQMTEAVAGDTSLPEALTEKVNEASEAVTLAVGTAGFNKAGEQICTDLVSGMSGLSSRMYNHGQQAMQGFINGLESKRGAVKSTVASIVNEASSTVTLHLSIASPSKLWYKYGAFTAEGFINGIRDKIGAVRSAVSNFTQVSEDAAYPTRAAAIREVNNNQVSGAVSNYTNVTQNIYAEKQSPAEMLREAKWQQQKAVLMGV